MNAGFIVLAITLIALPGAALAATATQKCESAKLKDAGKYQACRLNAAAKSFKTGAGLDATKCDSKFDAAWDKAETKGGSDCIDTLLDTSAIGDLLEQQTAIVNTIIVGAIGVPKCGDGVVDAIGELCDGNDLVATTCSSLAYSGGTLACDSSCKFDTSACVH